jgi:hypothetical protein
MWGEILTSREVEFCSQLLQQLNGVPWSRPLLARVGSPNDWSYERKPLLFELRFAGDLNAAKLRPTYEYSAGVGESTVDFRFEAGGSEWFVELVTLLTSDAVKRASWEDGLFFGAQLSTDAADSTQSVEGELLLAQQKIGEKVYTQSAPTKFPPPHTGTYHLILVDMRGFGITGGDMWDYRQIAYGPAGLPSNTPYLVHSWTDNAGNRRPILGLFDPSNTYQRAAQVVQERIHFIGFCNDESYALNGIRDNTLFLPNPHLFADDAAGRVVYDSYPLKAQANR